MDSLFNLNALVQQELDDFIAQKRADALQIGTELGPVFTEISAFLSGGKRFRATCLALGWVAAKPLSFTEYSRQLRAVTLAATALEMFHAAALVHDDIIDRSDSRRGRMSVHRTFESQHRKQKLHGDSTHFGAASAILIGDLLQSWADEMFDNALSLIDDYEARHTARLQFNTMRTEVAYGQYFDTLEEQRPTFSDEDTQLQRITRIMLYKTAKYSVEAPLLLGAMLAGGSSSLYAALSEFAVPTGILFQLRDDVLGAFGNPEATGKPAGDDLRHGKRTVLITLARGRLPISQQHLIDEILGTELSDEQVTMLQQTIKETGALQEVETMITNNLKRAEAAARSVEISADAVDMLLNIAHKIAYRDS